MWLALRRRRTAFTRLAVVPGRSVGPGFRGIHVDLGADSRISTPCLLYQLGRKLLKHARLHLKFGEAQLNRA
jgi:hypothetical protein